MRRLAGRARGRRLIGWDEILHGGLAPEAAVASWLGYTGGVTAVLAGHDVVMCPHQYSFVDYRESAGADESILVAHALRLEDASRFEPVPPQL